VSEIIPPEYGHRGEEGQVLASALFAITLLVGFVAATVTMGQLLYAKGQVTDAARNAAQAAAIVATSSQAQPQARLAAAGTLGPARCRVLNVAVDTAAFAPGGSVGVKVSCNVGLIDNGLIGIPGSVTLTGSSRAPMESYRRG